MGSLGSHLYIPADSERKVSSASRIAADSFILDLEDGVAENQKDLALSKLAQTVQKLDKKDVWVRINSGDHGLEDLEKVVAIGGLTGVWIPKAEPGATFDRMRKLAESADLELGALIESGSGYVGRQELLRHKSVTRVQIGEYDLRGDLGMAENVPATEPDLHPIRLEIVVSAISNDVSSIVAGVSSNFTDLPEYERSSLRMRDLGFNGRAVIHPSQVEVCQRVFYPTEHEIQQAKQIVDQFAEQSLHGIGAYCDDEGNMADAATVRRAQWILNQIS